MYHALFSRMMVVLPGRDKEGRKVLLARQGIAAVS